MTKDVFFKKVWHGAFVEEGNLTQTIFLLRKALGKLPDGGDYIETLSGYGYRLSPAALTHWHPLPESAPKLTHTGPSSTISLDPVLPEEEVAGPSFCESTSKDATDESPTAVLLHLPKHVTLRQLLWIALPVIGCLAFATWLLVRRDSRPAVIAITPLSRDHLSKPVRGPLLLEDNRLFFTEMLDGKSYLAQVSVKGGEVTRRMTPPGGAWSMTFLPMKDGPSALASLQDHEKRSETDMSELQAEPSPEGSLSGRSAAWAPDHKTLAFTRGHDLLIADALGSKMHVLKSFGDKPYWPAWSPDGKELRFTRSEGEGLESLWEIGADGAGLHPLQPGSPHQHRSCCGSWSTDGRHYVYVVEEFRSSALWVRTERSAMRPFLAEADSELVSGPVSFWRSPLFGSDRKSVYALGQDDRGELQQVSEQVQGKHAPYSNGLAVDTISFSHNGQWMAYSLYPQGTLWRSGLDGSNKIELSMPGRVASDAQWSPDDKTILFLSTYGNHLGSVKQVSSEGGGLRSILPCNLNQGSGTFSPDGRHVAFGQSRISGTGTPDNTSIIVVDLASGRSQELPSSQGLWTVRWSPAADQLAAVTGHHQLRLFNIRQQRWSEPTQTSVQDILWNGKGSVLYFTSVASPDTMLYQMSLRDRHVQPLRLLRNREGETFSGSHLSLGRSGEVLMMKRVNSTEVYRIQVKLP